MAVRKIQTTTSFIPEDLDNLSHEYLASIAHNLQTSAKMTFKDENNKDITFDLKTTVLVGHLKDKRRKVKTEIFDPDRVDKYDEVYFYTVDQPEVPDPSNITSPSPHDTDNRITRGFHK